MEINIDFDGTVVTHEYPLVGKDIGAVPILKKLVENGHNLILFTMRSEARGISPVTNKEESGGLEDAINWFKENNIPLYGIQTNPTQAKWTTSPKSYAPLMIDDSAIGCPLTMESLKFNEFEFLNKYGYSPFLSPPQADGYCEYHPARPYVDWVKVGELLKQKGLI